MANETNNPSDHRDALLSRVIDGEAGGADWAALHAMADADPSVWTELTATQHQHEVLSAIVDEVGASADAVEIPDGGLLLPGERFERRMALVRSWGGWAAAAAILLVWFTGLPETRRPVPQPDQQAGLVSAGVPAGGSPGSILDQYIEAGRQTGHVLGQVPRRVVVETNPVPGGVEVVYLRQIVEKAFVPSDRLYRLGRDEFGQAALVPDPEPLRVKASY